MIMNWDLLLTIYTTFCALMGRTVATWLKRVLKPAQLWTLGVLLLLLNLAIYLWRGTLLVFDTDDAVGFGLTFVTSPTLLLVLLICYDGIRQWLKKENQQ